MTCGLKSLDEGVDVWGGLIRGRAIIVHNLDLVSPIIVCRWARNDTHENMHDDQCLGIKRRTLQILRLGRSISVSEEVNISWNVRQQPCLSRVRSRWGGGASRG